MKIRTIFTAAFRSLTRKANLLMGRAEDLVSVPSGLAWENAGVGDGVCRPLLSLFLTKRLKRGHPVSVRFHLCTEVCSQ